MCKLLLTVVDASSWFITDPGARKRRIRISPGASALPFEYLPDKDDPEVVYVDYKRVNRAKILVGTLDHPHELHNYGIVFLGRWFRPCRNLEIAVEMAIRIGVWEAHFVPVYESSDDGHESSS